ncbi:MAG: MBL fold metallo-hydrolase [Deltaproteobacteria bacterium]|nr:MBL fold metallo-hydrolase [Deltaproteobacteria bacterium]
MPKLTEGIYFIPGRDEMIPDAHTYIIGYPSSKDLSLIDPGLISRGRYKIDSIKEMGITFEDIKRVIMSHTHFDHLSGIFQIKEEIPWAELWVHEAEASPLEQGDERTVYGMEMFRKMCEIEYGIKYGAFRMKVHRKLKGGDVLKIGGMCWEVLHIPGHSLGSIGLHCPSEKVLIPGDVIYADYAIGRFDLFGADGAVLKESLKKLSELDVKILLPGHNRTVMNLPIGYIQKTLAQWEPYLV